MRSFCSYCYKEVHGERLSACAQCRHRKYCSRECQVADWKQGHKHWCGKAGEIGYDYEIRETKTTGLGLFALRSFERGEKIMAERGIPENTTPTVTEMSAILALVPHNSTSLIKKYGLNAIGTGEYSPDVRHIFISMARVNHHCIGNSEHVFIAKHKVKTLTATRIIAAGEEISFCYIDYQGFPEQFHKIPAVWRFQCRCSACQDPIVAEKLKALHTLDQKMLTMGIASAELSVATANQLLQLYQELPCGFSVYMRTYFDLFQIYITRKATLILARECMQKLVDVSILLYGDIDIPEVVEYKQLLQDPTKHPFCGVADKRR